MTEQRKAGSVILANLAMFNESAILFENEVEPAFIEALDKAIEGWAEQQQWVGVFDRYSGNQTWLFPPEWHILGAEDEYDSKAWFYLDFLTGDGDAYDLADLCGVGQDEMGLIFRIKFGEFGGKSAWNKFVKSLPASIVAPLQGLGFNDCGKGVFFMPIKLDPSLLANAWENEDYEDLMQPVITVLDNIKQSIAIFNELFSLAKAAGLQRIE